jgi:hypothetical protein
MAGKSFLVFRPVLDRFSCVPASWHVISVNRGIDVDKPSNLSKAVLVD